MHSAEYAAFAAALCDAQAPAPEFLRAPPGIDIHDRIAVYRNTVHVGLVDALAASYPIVLAQVGEEFFRAMARQYVLRHKPADPVLTLYGAGFPAFIAAYEPAASLGWLPDLAALERAWTESWAAQDAPSLPITALRAHAPEEMLQVCLYAHPAARLVRSAWPVADLWQAHQSPQPDLSTLDWQPQNVLLTRPQASVSLRLLDEAGAQFAAALIAGETIEAAAELAPGAAVGPLLEQLFHDGFVLGIRS